MAWLDSGKISRKLPKKEESTMISILFSIPLITQDRKTSKRSYASKNPVRELHKCGKDGHNRDGCFDPRSLNTSSKQLKDVRWIEAMKQEIQALEENKTWTLEELPKGKRAIDSKWVYKIKYKPNGDVERYKARLVAKGCN
ncbi:putative RNA-directed DNA polymerase [Tanacetum coccineum]|uniref:RNA-directed DNA polymerase n=1 Tax=Tanacetum coccineum TaxID=301880 RepID=A0ABQ5ISP0_9ASTR